jgi:hypothetical protein
MVFQLAYVNSLKRESRLRTFYKIYLRKLEFIFAPGFVVTSGGHGYGYKCPLQQLEARWPLEYYRKYIPE